MLKEIDLTNKMDKKIYKDEIEYLKIEMEKLQHLIKEYKIPVLIAFDGWSASGKGTFISKIVQPLDPRNFNVYTMAKVNEEAQMRPVLWSYFTKTPIKGRIAIFDKSWNRASLPEISKKWTMNKKAVEGFNYDANAFEKSLRDNGTLIIKFFLHISKEEQKKRFEHLLSNKSTMWRIDKADMKQNEEYNENLRLFSHMIETTSKKHGEWSIIPADDTKYATVQIYKSIIKKVKKEIERIKNLNDAPTMKKADFKEFKILKEINLKKDISNDVYDQKLDELQMKISELGFQLYQKRRSVVIVYEGWDAAGKGGNIKRGTSEMDPRGYEVVPIASPTVEELNHHYLWRFWNKMPKDGHTTIFDRSWYGRVMVERVEGYATKNEWARAYDEINDMELHMSNHGTIIFKFWLHIDKEEQLKRFRQRENNPLKAHKITDEDWRNREKWDQYEKAVNEMLHKTNKKNAPWVIIESNSKKYARIKVLENIVKRLTKEL